MLMGRVGSLGAVMLGPRDPDDSDPPTAYIDGEYLESVRYEIGVGPDDADPDDDLPDFYPLDDREAS